MMPKLVLNDAVSVFPRATLFDFPLDIWIHISSHLPPLSIFHLQCTSHHYYELLSANEIWKNKVITNWYQLKHERELSDPEPNSYQEHFQTRSRDDIFVQNLITCIVKNEMTIEDNFKQLELVYANFNDYVPQLIRETEHLNENFQDEAIFFKEAFHKLQRIRLKSLRRIYVASEILNSGRILNVCRAYYKIDTRCPDDKESVLMSLAYIDSCYYDLLPSRDRVLKKTICKYLEKEWTEGTRATEKLIHLVNCLVKAIRSERQLLSDKVSDVGISETNFEDLSILRFYSGDSDCIQMVRNIVIEKLCAMVELESIVDINESCVRIKDDKVAGGVMFMILKNSELFVVPITQMPQALLNFGDQEGYSEEQRKYFYTSIMSSYYSDHAKRSRLECELDSDTHDQLIYYRAKDRKKRERVIMSVFRDGYWQGQILSCGGEVKSIDVKLIENLFSYIKTSSSTFVKDELLKHSALRPGCFISMLVQMGKELNSESLLDNIRNYQARRISMRHEVFKFGEIFGYHSLDLISCENISLGDVVWMDSRNIRGVVIGFVNQENVLYGEESFNFPDRSLDQINGLQRNKDKYSAKEKLYVGYSRSNERMKIFKLPYILLFCGFSGFHVASPDEFWNDSSDMLIGMSTYDCLGNFFSYYDWNEHKFMP